MRMGIGLGVGINRSNYAQGIFNAYSARVVADGGVVESGTCVDAVSSLLQSASLLLIPSGYKGGKLYSEIPTNGNGDLTWTRGSDAFRTNASGVLQRVPWNLLQYSEMFSDINWGKEGSSITANTTNAPNGTLTADSLTENSAASTQHRLLQNTGTIASGAIFTFSCYVKQGVGTRDFALIATSAGIRVYFNLSTGTVGTQTLGTGTISNVGDGWYRVTATGTSTATSAACYLAMTNGTTTGSETYSGNGTSSLIIWGAQLVEGTTAQTYLPTTDRLNFPRISYMYGSCPSVLLEPQRTNVVLWSSDLSQSVWSKTNYALSSATAIQGLTATRITKNATSNGTWNGSGARNVINSVGTFASGTKAFSVLLRKGNTAKVGLLINGILVGALTNVSCEFDFATETFTNVATGLTATFEKPTTDVYRLILVCNDIGIGTSKQLWIAPIDSSNNTVTDGYVDVAYFQWELGAYHTTYIPTTSATATRVADSFSRSNIYTNGLISASGGTWFVEVRNNIIYTRDANTRFGIGDTTALTTNSLFFIGDIGNRINLWKCVSGSVSQLYITLTNTTKFAFKWNGTTVDIFANGTKVVSATAFTATNMEHLIGALGVPVFIQQMALFPTPLSDTDCTTLTTL